MDVALTPLTNNNNALQRKLYSSLSHQHPSHHRCMAHVARLAVRPDDQFSAKINPSTDPNAIVAMPSSLAAARGWLPAPLRFPAAVLTTFTLSSLLYSLSAGITGPELAAVSRNLTTGWHIAAMIVFKVAELGIAWYACYDYLDLAYLTLLNNVPHYFLLNTFYGIDVLASVVPLLIDIITISLPFALFRQLDSGHANPEVKTSNQQVVQDKSIQSLVAIFGASVYSIVIYGSLISWLPVYMATHFDGLRSFEKAHAAAIPNLLAIFVPLGFAASQFIFVPAVGSTANPGTTDPKIAPEKVPFNPETASFSQTLAYNLGLGEAGFTPRAQILAKRTSTLAAASFINAFVRTYVTIEGTEVLGAAGWASVWALASGAAGIGFNFIANE